MPFMNNYNKHIADLMHERREKLMRHLDEQDLNVHANMDDVRDVYDDNRQEGGSGSRMGPNEATGAFEMQNGILARQIGGANKAYAQVNRDREDESVRGAGMPEIYGTQHPFKHPYKNEGSGVGMGKEDDEDTLYGAGWWDDFKDGFMSVINPAISVATSLAPIALKAFGAGKKRGRPAKKKIEGDGFFDDIAIKNPFSIVAKQAMPTIKKIIKHKDSIADIAKDIIGEGKKKRGRPSKLKAGVRVEKELEGGANLNLIPTSMLPGSSMSGMGTGSGTGSGTLLMDILRPKKKGGSHLVVNQNKINETMVKDQQPMLKMTADPLVKIKGGKKKAPSKWALLVKQVMGGSKLKMKDAIKHIKDNNLYQK